MKEFYYRWIIVSGFGVDFKYARIQEVTLSRSYRQGDVFWFASLLIFLYLSTGISIALFKKRYNDQMEHKNKENMRKIRKKNGCESNREEISKRRKEDYEVHSQNNRY